MFENKNERAKKNCEANCNKKPLPIAKEKALTINKLHEMDLAKVSFAFLLFQLQMRLLFDMITIKARILLNVSLERL